VSISVNRADDLREYLRSVSKLVLVVTEDLSLLRYGGDELDKADLGFMGFSFNSPNRISIWMRREEGEYDVLNFEDEELWGRFPHHELLGRKVREPLRDLIDQLGRR